MLTERTVIKHIIKLMMVVSQITASTRLKHRDIPAVVGNAVSTSVGKVCLRVRNYFLTVC